MTYRTFDERAALTDELRRLHESGTGQLRETQGRFIAPPPGVEKNRQRGSLIGLLTVLCTLLTCGLAFTALVLGLERPVPPPSPQRTLAAPLEDECTFCRENLRWLHDTNLVGDPCARCNRLFSDSFVPEPPPPMERARPLRLASAPNKISVLGPLSRQRATLVVMSYRDEIEACARNALFDELAREPDGMRARRAHDDAPRYFELVLSVLVQPDGRNQEASFTEQPWHTVDGPMQACLRRVAANWDFGPSAVSLVRVHLHFEPL